MVEFCEQRWKIGGYSPYREDGLKRRDSSRLSPGLEGFRGIVVDIHVEGAVGAVRGDGDAVRDSGNCTIISIVGIIDAWEEVHNRVYWETTPWGVMRETVIMAR